MRNNGLQSVCLRQSSVQFQHRIYAIEGIWLEDLIRD